MKQLIIGGARSGKSRLAEQLATTSGKQLIYLATSDAQQNDAEMAARINHHQARRDTRWHTIEEPFDLAQVLSEYNRADCCVLIDCTTLWLSNCLLTETHWPQQKQRLLDCLPTLECEVIFVGNEVGQGIVPLGEINRRFVDESGWLHQQLAQHCERVIFTAAGLPLVLKGEPLA